MRLCSNLVLIYRRKAAFHGSSSTSSSSSDDSDGSDDRRFERRKAKSMTKARTRSVYHLYDIMLTPRGSWGGGGGDNGVDIQRHFLFSCNHL